ncbi:hypothetical protein [Actinomycetospora cinnamomea]|uniref:Uncharacterized protein n=1 Tax=Actinomycetospora cinnamomea TaxID=663609 RepID=A0A2U1FQA0_9PSEU|nr:hypothetical protein [Actinomycetospora cinnamomea]PVZ14326.1 hypothetical protein C8D89_101190 [Actinomycetospora cinnamomea]
MTVLLVVLPVLLPTPASADPQVRCTLEDARLAEVSGLVEGPEGPQVVNDSGNPSTVFRLDGACAVVGLRAVPVDGRDVEDLARRADGTLWIADIGDNGRRRSSVAVLRLDPDGGEVVTRLAYPDGGHDAESLLMPGDDRPVIVTKDLGGRSGIYVADDPVGEEPALTPRPLRRAGEVVVPGEALTDLGAGSYTGGAISSDGRVVALRTYADAWLYAAPHGTASAEDVVAALQGPPVRVPLPGEIQGEAIAFTPDGSLLSAGETPAAREPAALRVVPGAAGLVDSGAPAPSPAPTAAPMAVPMAVPTPERVGLPGPLLTLGAVLLAGAVGAAVVALMGRGRRRGGG